MIRFILMVDQRMYSLKTKAIWKVNAFYLIDCACQACQGGTLARVNGSAVTLVKPLKALEDNKLLSETIKSATKNDVLMLLALRHIFLVVPGTFLQCAGSHPVETTGNRKAHQTTIWALG